MSDSALPRLTARRSRPVAAPATLPDNPAFAMAKPPRRRHGPAVYALVTVMHAGLIWVIQGEMRKPPAEMTEPEVTLIQMVDMPLAAARPKAAERKPTPKPPTPKPTPVRRQQAPLQTTDVTPIHVAAAPAAPADPPPSPRAAAGPPGPPDVRSPAEDADYPSTCKVVYPPLSRAMHERGRVVLKILVGVDGRSKKLEMVRSSGSPRLDTAAQDAMRRCRFKPGTVDGVPQDMSYEAPVEFVLR
jgi:protein TonB